MANKLQKQRSLEIFFFIFCSEDNNNNSVKDTIQDDAWRAIQYSPIYGHYKMPVDSSTTDFQESFSPVRRIRKIYQLKKLSYFSSGGRDGAGKLRTLKCWLQI